VSLTALCPNLDLRIGDALKFDYGELPPDTVVVANLPYYVSTPLLFKLLEFPQSFDRLILMMQTEVAQRLAAQPGTKEYGALSVIIQYRAIVTVSFRVSPNCFRPRPTVGSAVVHLQIRPARSLNPADETRFIRLVRAAFSHRRKTLVNSLRDEGYAADVVTAALNSCRIAIDRRAESLSLDDYLALTAALNEAGETSKQ
jgi:16S rRNA (adenine1518-N6/adenine1519-N6)-dimethyltransferase